MADTSDCTHVDDSTSHDGATLVGEKETELNRKQLYKMDTPTVFAANYVVTHLVLLVALRDLKNVK